MILRSAIWFALVLAVALAGMRVLVDSVPYEVVAVQPDVGGREYVDLICQVVT